MEFRKVVLASFLALSLVACGDKDDNKEKPDDNKPTVPEKDADCVAAGDKCQLVDGKWVIKGDGNNGGDAPVVNSPFDYSDIGVTDELAKEKRGFGFYHKGVNSPLDAKLFDNLVTLSPSIPWSSTSKYDPDLYNFVALRIHNPSNIADSKGKDKYMFDKIGEKNQEVNKNVEFFGNGVNDNTAAGNIGITTITKATAVDSYDAKYMWNTLPAVVNTFMWVDDKGKLAREYKDAKNKFFYNQEEDKDSDMGSGKVPLRIYGVNAFLEPAVGPAYSQAANVIDPDSKKPGNPSSPNKYTLKIRNTKEVHKHVNFVWYNLSTLSQRKQKAFLDDTKNVHSALQNYNTVTKIPFPTDVEYGVLNSVQFGRLTGQGINPEAPSLDGYDDKRIKLYPFTTSTAATAGNDKGEDWYFARGTVPTKPEVLAGKKGRIEYNGQAVMFGLDYDPAKQGSRKKEAEPEDDKSTNSVMPKEDSGGDPIKVKTLLDGKQNFVHMIWDADSGKIKGRVYGVWTLATNYRATKDYGPATDDIKKGDIMGLAKDSKKDVIIADETKTNKVTPNTLANAQNIADKALVLEPWQKNLVILEGQVEEGTNSFSGTAQRCKDGEDGEKGFFMGGFFGPAAAEIGGVINSQTGKMNDKGLGDPTNKWGGSFGAQTDFTAPAQEEYLDFPEEQPTDYDTATEIF